MKQYFKNIIQTSFSLLYGLKITMRHFWQARQSRTPVGVEDKSYFEQKDGIVTLQYPFEQLPVPDTGRYQLHNEIDDCIVCDKCAKVCPVNCIDIEPVRAVEEIGKTSDGTSKRIYAAKFDIDMSKCCFCGLCTVVCPTECLTMTKDYDFSVFDLKEHNFEFGDMSPEMVAEKKAEFDTYSAEKEKAKAAAAASKSDGSTVEKPKVGGAFKPKVKTTMPAEDAKPQADGEKQNKPTGKPVFRPKMKSAVKSEDSAVEKQPAAKPMVKPADKSEESEESTNAQTPAEENAKPKAAKPLFRPKIKPAKPKDSGDQPKTND
ncbi:MAG: 4Fe-4S binding protein [Reichenbachiella sp.]|uniref:4Fe-4S binding protein n=1 Tax=Reichenbachiella sp. TaxID=2184521 RepID=UPI003262F83F